MEFKWECLDVKSSKIKVLYIFPLDRDYLAVDTLPEIIKNRYKFYFIDSEHFSYSSKASKEFSLIDFIDKCIQKIMDESIDIVISTRDMADLVHSILSNKFNHIRGLTNFVSSFITLYKPYTRLFIDNDNPTKYQIINIRDKKWQNMISNPNTIKSLNTFNSLISTLNGKGFMKPPAASCSSLVGDFNNIHQFINLLNMHSNHGKIFNHYLPDFVDKYTSKQLQLFNSSEISDILLIEEFINTPIKITVDGCVLNKKIYIWGVVDSIYWTNIGKNECFIGCCIPSNLSQNICNKLVLKYTKIVNRLITEYGFNDQFIDIEYFVIPQNKNDLKKCISNVSNWKYLNINNVDIKLMEINARAFIQMNPIYRRVFDNYNGDIISTLLKMYDPSININDNNFSSPKLKNNICGLNGYLNTFSSDIADNLFDFDAAQKYINKGQVILSVKTGDIVNTISQQGTLLAYVNVIGENYQQCFDKMMKIYKELVKKGAPWQGLTTGLTIIKSKL